MKILSRVFCIVTVLIFINQLNAQSFSNHIKAVDMSTMKKTHPRVLVNDFEVIKQNLKTNLLMQSWLKDLKEEKGMDALALAYILTGETSKIVEAINTALNLDWDKSIKTGGHHYGPMLMRAACVYDWLHDVMNLSQREKMQQLLKKILEAYLKDPDKTNFHNFNHVLNAGAIVAAVAVADEEPELAKKVFNLAINTLNLTWYKPDGVTPEGPHYMAWSSLVMFSGLATLNSAFGESFGLSDEPGLMGYGDFVMNTTIARKGLSIKFGDCYTNGGFYNLGQLFWIANKFNRPDLDQFAIENDPFIAKGENPDYSGKLNNLLWYNPVKFKTDPDNFKKLSLDKQFKGAQLAVMRSNWGDDNTFFAGIKGTDDYRQANFFHRHNNTGTFFLNALGEQWCLDLGLEDYLIKEYNVQPRLYYKLRAEGHNCNIINPASGIDNKGWEKCPIINQGSNLQESFAIVDMTPDYVQLAKSAKRGLKMFDHRRKVLIQDEISSIDGKPFDSYWFMQTEAGIEIAQDGRSALLYRGNEKMLVYMATAPKDARFTVMGTEPLVYTRPVGSKQDWTFGAKKLTIHTNTETDLKLAIVFVPVRQGETAVKSEIPYEPLDSWKVSADKEAVLSGLMVDNKEIEHFDPRNFTYDFYHSNQKIPNIKASTNIKDAKVVINQAKNIPGKAEITVSAEGIKPSTYFVYFREKHVQIVASAAREYSSWDESFANHRIVARKISGGMNSDYDLGESCNVSAATIGFTYQNKAYNFEILASDDQRGWKSIYSGESTVIDGLKAAMPQLFTFPAFKARYIRISNPDKSPSFTIDILRFYKNAESAKEYLNHAYREVLSDVKISPKELNLKTGDKAKLSFEGITNYSRSINLNDAKFSFESEKPDVVTISASGEITAKEDGEVRIRIIIQKGDFVFHKKVLVSVTNPALKKITAESSTYLNSKKADKNFSAEKIISAGETTTALLRFDTKQLAGKSIKKAVIRLFAANSSFTTIKNVFYLTANEWNPTTVNFFTKPTQGKLIATFEAPANITDYVDVDITQTLNELAKSGEILSIMLTSNSDISYTSINEKDDKPILIIY